MKRKKVNIYITDELARMIKVKAAKMGRKIYEVYEEAVKRYLKM